MGHRLVFVGLMTFILIMSSVTMVLAVEAGHRNSKKEVVWWMIGTIIGGAMFLGCQALEWNHLQRRGFLVVYHPQCRNFKRILWKWYTAGTAKNVIPPVCELILYDNRFPRISTCIQGVMINIIITINVLFGTYERRGSYNMVEKVGLYWHFVDLVWVFVFTFFYLV